MQYLPHHNIKIEERESNERGGAPSKKEGNGGKLEKWKEITGEVKDTKTFTVLPPRT